MAIGRAAAQLPFLVIFLAMLAPSCAGNQGWDRHPGPAEVPLGPDNKQLRWVPTDARIRGIFAGKAVLPDGVWMTALDPDRPLSH